jgi:O-acetylhomoserine/O-acetylserine sulfhydrylase-like pyridoxal-dependent enzyme
VNGISVYPNPTQSRAELKINAKESGLATISISNMIGQTVKVMMDINVNVGQNLIELNDLNLKTGSYIISIQQNNKNLGVTRLNIQ